MEATGDGHGNCRNTGRGPSGAACGPPLGSQARILPRAVRRIRAASRPTLAENGVADAALPGGADTRTLAPFAERMLIVTGGPGARRAGVGFDRPAVRFTGAWASCWQTDGQSRDHLASDIPSPNSGGGCHDGVARVSRDWRNAAVAYGWPLC